MCEKLFSIFVGWTFEGVEGGSLPAEVSLGLRPFLLYYGPARSSQGSSHD